MSKILDWLVPGAWGSSLNFAGNFVPGGVISGGNDVMGYDTIGASSGALSADVVACSALDSPSNNGTVGTIHIYSTNGTSTEDVKVGIYDDSSGTPNNLVGSEQTFTDVGTWTAEWHAFGLSPGLSVSSGTSYWICAQVSSGFMNAYWDTPGGTNRHWDNLTYGTTWNDPYDSNSNSSAKYSLKADVSW